MNRKIRIIWNNFFVHFIDGLFSNLSRLIYRFAWKRKKKLFLKELEEAYQAQDNDPEFKAKVSVWDVTANDGLNT
ncbi:MAG: hypothetical protein SW833_26110 [Cyanobacteriota bacterium]|nr:hypothetical protein [Cyanobacteriota bacterium]